MTPTSSEESVEPIWVRDDVVAAIHRRQIGEHSGGSDSVRDPNLLSSALARPKNLYAYGEPMSDLAALSAAYTFGIARNHPFIDGNKRTALVVGRTFLRINGHDITATQTEKYRAYYGVAAGELSEEALADWIRKRLITAK